MIIVATKALPTNWKCLRVIISKIVYKMLPTITEKI